MNKERQSELNIGVVGHVDHGKTTLTSKLTGKWTDKHSDEIKQGISIKLGYADAVFYRCSRCNGVQAYGTAPVCRLCGEKTEVIKKVSFVDAPGHETLMAVMLSGATLLNGALLVVAANEECPQPRTVEHLSALKMHGVKNIVVAQNKIDLVSKEDAKKNYEKLRKFLDDEGYSHTPIIPTSAHFDTNMDALVYALSECIPAPENNPDAPLRLQVVRSFDINKPGTDIDKLKGGILGGAVLQGTISVGQKLWLYPGISKPLEISVESLNMDGIVFDKVHPGGLVAIGTKLDPYQCYADRMVGQIVCEDKSKPFMSSKLDIKYTKVDRLIEPNMMPFKVGEKIVLVIGSAAYLGTITKVKGETISLFMNKDAVYYKTDKIAVSRNINGRWRLAGYGEVK